MTPVEWFLQLPLLSQILLTYAVLVNVITFFYFGIDKIKSQVDSWRVSENTLWLLALIGGSLGALAGMKFFRHKISKNSFQAIITLILLVQLGVFFLFFIN